MEPAHLQLEKQTESNGDQVVMWLELLPSHESVTEALAQRDWTRDALAGDER
jgi:hypothetical protein